MRNKIYIEPPESERKYQKLAKLGQELGVPVPQMFLEMEVKDRDGKTVHHHKQRSHSWVRNAYNVLFTHLASVNAFDATYAAGKLSIREVGGTVQHGSWPLTSAYVSGGGQTSSQFAALSGYTSAAGVITSGIQVGSSDDVETFEDYHLHTQIVNATLAHSVSNAYVVAYDPGPPKILSATLVRYFNNNTVGNVDVKEVGLVKTIMPVNPTCFYTLMSRDKLGATVTVPPMGQLKCTYVISLVYPA